MVGSTDADPRITGIQMEMFPFLTWYHSYFCAINPTWPRCIPVLDAAVPSVCALCWLFWTNAYEAHWPGRGVAAPFQQRRPLLALRGIETSVCLAMSQSQPGALCSCACPSPPSRASSGALWRGAYEGPLMLSAFGVSSCPKVPDGSYLERVKALADSLFLPLWKPRMLPLSADLRVFPRIFFPWGAHPGLGYTQVPPTLKRSLCKSLPIHVLTDHTLVAWNQLWWECVFHGLVTIRAVLHQNVDCWHLPARQWACSCLEFTLNGVVSWLRLVSWVSLRECSDIANSLLSLMDGRR